MPSFTWLNLTDLHMGLEDQGWLWPRVRESFFDDLSKLIEHAGRIDAVLFTGDLTQAGLSKEFELFDRFLAELWPQLQRDSAVFLAVPGNHDLRRPTPNAAVDGLTRHWTTDPELSKQFWHDRNSDYRQVVNEAFSEYSRWWAANERRLGLPVIDGLLPGDFSTTIELDGMRVGVLGLNTAFLQLAGGPFEQKLSLHPQQFTAATGGDGPKWINQHDVCLLMTHHPVAWLEPAARDMFLRRFTPMNTSPCISAVICTTLQWPG